MVLPLVFGAIRTAALRFAPSILPFAKKVATTIGGFVVKKPIKTSAILIGGGFLAASPTARQTVLTAPKSLVETGRAAGTRFETSIEREDETTPIGKALKIGGTAGLVAAAGLIAARSLKKRREAGAIAASPVTAIPTIPTTPGAIATVPSVVTPLGAITPKPKPKRRAQRKPSTAPVFINQIQIEN